ncbi:beta-glucuronosyltransferase GlcAT14B-like isoform X2 [Magnolia sinica]|uniref:beta-glucuronosyltransferase GlcAT14B-like isoform X2 n=1 Tax=Magnolia sinica TaxID=86752 RepID=UPI0026592BA1|nr:beta-glucuronosyltransferase GlcAT14B-like isoform X2 [Magnolia sinica]
MGKSPTLLFLFLLAISLLLISLVSKTTPPRPPKISHSTNLHNPFPPPPKIAYFISTSDGDGPRTVRLLSAVYHPSYHYLLHLDRRAPQAKRDDLAGVVGAVDAFTAAGNVNVFGKADPLNIEGPTAVAAVLRGAAALMRRWKDWDWFDYTRWISPGGWCVGRSNRGNDLCQLWCDADVLRPELRGWRSFCQG